MPRGIQENQNIQAIKDLLNAKGIPGSPETGKIENFFDALMNPRYSGKSWNTQDFANRNPENQEDGASQGNLGFFRMPKESRKSKFSGMPCESKNHNISSR